MLDGLDNASIEIKEAKVCLDSYILLFFFFAITSCMQLKSSIYFAIDHYSLYAASISFSFRFFITFV